MTDITDSPAASTSRHGSDGSVVSTSPPTKGTTIKARSCELASRSTTPDVYHHYAAEYGDDTPTDNPGLTWENALGSSVNR